MAKTITAFVKLAGQLDPSFEKTFNTAQKEMANLQRTSQSLKNLGNGMQKTGRTLTRNVTLPIIGAGAAAVKVTADLDAAMSEVGALSGATGKEFDALRDKAIEMGSKTKFTATESAEAMKYMALAGWETQQMLDGLPGILNLAAASGEDLATTSDIVTDALTAFGMKANESGHFADVLAKASASANTDVGMMGEAFSYVANNAGALGYSIEDTSFAIGLLGDAAIKSGRAGTTLQQAFKNMSAPSAKAKKQMDKLGLSMFDAEGKAKPLKQVLDETRAAMRGLNDEEKARAVSDIFGSRASGMLAIINRSEKEYDRLYSKISDSNGAAGEMSAKMLDNLKGQLTILKSQFESIGIQIGDALMPTLKKFASFMQKAASWFSGLSDGQRMMIIRLAGVAAAIGPVLLVGGKLLTLAGQGIEAFRIIKGLGMAARIAKLGGAFKMFGTIARVAFMLIPGPVKIAIAVIAGLIAIGVAVYKNWDTIKAKASQLSAWVSGKMSQMGAFVSSKLAAIKNFFSSAIQFIVRLFYVRFVLIPRIILNALSGAAASARTALQNVKQVFVNKLTEIANWVAQKLAQIRNAFAHPITATINIAKNIKEKISKKVSKKEGKAKGGFTHGLTYAGEDPRYPVEAVLSFNPRYREQNLAYWAKAGRMLGATPADMTNTKATKYGGVLPSENRASAKVGKGLSNGMTISGGRSTFNAGGITFSPTVNITGKAGETIDEQTIMKALRDLEPEFVDFVMQAIGAREEGSYVSHGFALS